MLRKYNLDTRVSTKDAVHLVPLLELRSEAPEKVGVGIDHFEVRSPPPELPPFSDRCFWVLRTDGTAVDFSYLHCLRPTKEMMPAF